MNKVLLVGGAGYIGTALTEYLLAKKYNHTKRENNNYIDGDYEDVEENDDRKI